MLRHSSQPPAQGASGTGAAQALFGRGSYRERVDARDKHHIKKGRKRPMVSIHEGVKGRGRRALRQLLWCPLSPIAVLRRAGA